jgi:hypothetical protein
LADVRFQIAMELLSNIRSAAGQPAGDPRPGAPHDGRHRLVQGKTQTAALVEWTPALHAVVDRVLALPTDMPKACVLRARSGRPSTPTGFGAMWQRLIRNALDGGAIWTRFKFHDLRALEATEKAETKIVASELVHQTRARNRRITVGLVLRNSAYFHFFSDASLKQYLTAIERADHS